MRKINLELTAVELGELKKALVSSYERVIELKRFYVAGRFLPNNTNLKQELAQCERTITAMLDLEKKLDIGEFLGK